MGTRGSGRTRSRSFTPGGRGSAAEAVQPAGPLLAASQLRLRIADERLGIDFLPPGSQLLNDVSCRVDAVPDPLAEIAEFGPGGETPVPRGGDQVAPGIDRPSKMANGGLEPSRGRLPIARHPQADDGKGDDAKEIDDGERDEKPVSQRHERLPAHRPVPFYTLLLAGAKLAGQATLRVRGEGLACSGIELVIKIVVVIRS